MMMMDVTATDDEVGLTWGLFAFSILCRHQTTTQKSQHIHLRDITGSNELVCCKPYRRSTRVYGLKDAEA